MPGGKPADPGIGFDRYISQIDEVAPSGDHDAMDNLNGEYGVTVIGPSVAQRLGIS